MITSLLKWKAEAFRYIDRAFNRLVQIHGPLFFTREIMGGIAGLLVLLLFFPVYADAYSGLAVNIKVVRAVRDNAHVDTELAGLAREVGPVLNFTGFSLIKKSEMPLRPERPRRLLLSDNRSMTLKLAGFEKDQARLKIIIYKKGKEIFATTLLLVNNGSALIGGPKLEKGVMMISISGRFTP